VSSMTTRVSQALTGRAGAAYRRLVDHCAKCRRCKPVLDQVGRVVGAPAYCPEADALRREWDTARKEAAG
jgi:hypothetical protein